MVVGPESNSRIALCSGSTGTRDGDLPPSETIFGRGESRLHLKTQAGLNSEGNGVEEEENHDRIIERIQGTFHLVI